MIASGISQDTILTPVGQIRFAEIDGESSSQPSLGAIERSPERGVVSVGVQRDGVVATEDDIEVGRAMRSSSPVATNGFENWSTTRSDGSQRPPSSRGAPPRRKEASGEDLNLRIRAGGGLTD